MQRKTQENIVEGMIEHLKEMSQYFEKKGAREWAEFARQALVLEESLYQRERERQKCLSKSELSIFLK